MRTLRRADIAVAVAAVAVVLFVALLPSPRDNNPPIPDTPEHRGLSVGQACLSCHGSGGIRPLPARHPPRQDCQRCHRELADGTPPDGTRTDRRSLRDRHRADGTEEPMRPWKETRRWSRLSC